MLIDLMTLEKKKSVSIIVEKLDFQLIILLIIMIFY